MANGWREDTIKCEIVQNIAVLSTKGEWSKEVNVVAWGNREPKVDIREWSADHKRMTKGVTLTPEEAETLAMALHNYIAERR